MKRVIFILAVVFLSVSSPGHAEKVYRVSALVADDIFVPSVEAFKQKMTDLGYSEGKNIRYDFNNAKGDRELLANMAKQIVESKPDLIVTSSTTATLPIAKLTRGSNLPVVFLSSANPLVLVKSYASSGNNLTGISDSTLDIIGKQMELLKELLPKAKRVMSISVTGETNYKQIRHQTREAAKKFGLAVVDILVDKPEDIKSKLAIAIEREAGDAVFASLNLSMLNMREEMIRQATLTRIPVIATGIETVRKGALATYTSDFSGLGTQGALLVDRILKGAKPSDLPIEQPIKLKLVINLKTAKAIGLTIPKKVLIRADEIIE